MKKNARYIFLFPVVVIILVIAAVFLQSWLNRPLPVSLNAPEAQPIKDILARSQEIENTLFCEPTSDINMLADVYVDTSGYKPSKDGKALITKYLGEDSVKNAGYLTYIKAYHLWRRSGDPYPRSSPEITQNSSTQIAPTEKPVMYCPDPMPETELSFRSIAIRENKALVHFDTPTYLKEAILIKVGGVWYIASMRNLQVHV